MGSKIGAASNELVEHILNKTFILEKLLEIFCCQIIEISIISMSNAPSWCWGKVVCPVNAGKTNK
jgi:hypothetical protein